MTSTFKKFLDEPKLILKDIYNFFSSYYKIPLSHFFNLLPYQSLRINIDDFMTNKSQKKLINKYEKNFLTKKFEEGKDGGIIVNKEFFNQEIILGLHEICTKILTQKSS